MATAVDTFDGVSITKGRGNTVKVFLQLSDLETTSSFLGNVKPKNADLPTCEVTPDEIHVQITLNVDGSRLTYHWEKKHNGRIAKAEVKVEKKQLLVTLTKSHNEDWDEMFIKYLHDM